MCQEKNTPTGLPPGAKSSLLLYAKGNSLQPVCPQDQEQLAHMCQEKNTPTCSAPQTAKYYATTDRWFSTARSSTCTKRPNLAMSMTCLATSSSEILCNNRQMVLFSKKQYLHKETHPCNSPGLPSNLNQRNIMQKQTYGSLQQETILALRDPPLQFTWPAQQPQSAKYYATADRWFSTARSNTCTKRPTLAIHLTFSATSISEILCKSRQIVLFSKKQYLH